MRFTVWPVGQQYTTDQASNMAKPLPGVMKCKMCVDPYLLIITLNIICLIIDQCRSRENIL